MGRKRKVAAPEAGNALSVAAVRLAGVGGADLPPQPAAACDELADELRNQGEELEADEPAAVSPTQLPAKLRKTKSPEMPDSQLAYFFERRIELEQQFARAGNGNGVTHAQLYATLADDLNAAFPAQHPQTGDRLKTKWGDVTKSFRVSFVLPVLVVCLGTVAHMYMTDDFHVAL
jgi:hypothetical protein